MTRLVRHQDSGKGRRTPFSLWQRHDGSFEQYQTVQVKTPFFDATAIASFVVNHAKETVFVGLFAVGKRGTNIASEYCPLYDIHHEVGTVTKYEIKKLEQLSKYEGRLVVDWGAATRSWVQISVNQNKPIIALDRAVSEPQFPGFARLQPLDSEELFATPTSWQMILSQIGGVYLLTCQASGALYVGSAYGDGGFWGRWVQYAEGGDGGNVLLRNRGRSSYWISILDTAPISASREEIIALEQLWKRKLGSRAHGLNGN